MGKTALHPQIEFWRNEVFRDKNFLVGAAVGSGLVAQASVRGGANFLIALSAGILRQRGAPSIASMLPIGCDNRAVESYAQTEILGKVDVPILFGASIMDMKMDQDAFLHRIKARGFSGVVNFPGSQHFGIKIKNRLSALGLDTSEECKFLKKAQDIGLIALAYVSNRAEAKQMAEAGIKIICLNYGWNIGGEAGLDIGVSVDSARDLALRVSEDIHKINKEAIFLIEGGPIKDVLDIFKVSSMARAHGYIGGSTLDRLPLERAVARQTSAFKSARFQTPKTRMQTINNHVFSSTLGLVGSSHAIQETREKLSKFANSHRHILLYSQTGNRTEEVARSIIKLSTRGHKKIYFTDLDNMKGREYIHLFGGYNIETCRRSIGLIEKAAGGVLLIKTSHKLNPKLLSMIKHLKNTDRYVRDGDNLAMACNTRLILIVETKRFDDEFDKNLKDVFGKDNITLPSLSLRAEDIPDLAKQYLNYVEDKTGHIYHFHASSLPLLVGYAWPGNLEQFYEVIEDAITKVEGIEIGRTPVKQAIERLSQSIEPQKIADERQLILNALNRNRFRKGETAAELGITRRTLYNKLKKFNLDHL